jgi:hypothetical protein
MPMTIPLVRDLNDSLKETFKVTSKIRNMLGQVYATYAMTFYAGMFLPYFALNWITEYSSKPYTMAFSNTPGLLKPLLFSGRKSLKMFNFVLPTGLTGIGVSAISYVDYFKMGCTADEAIMKDPERIVELMDSNMRWYIEEGSRREATD